MPMLRLAYTVHVWWWESINQAETELCFHVLSMDQKILFKQWNTTKSWRCKARCCWILVQQVLRLCPLLSHGAGCLVPKNAGVCQLYIYIWNCVYIKNIYIYINCGFVSLWGAFSSPCDGVMWDSVILILKQFLLWNCETMANSGQSVASY